MVGPCDDGNGGHFRQSTISSPILAATVPSPCDDPKRYHCKVLSCGRNHRMMLDRCSNREVPVRYVVHPLFDAKMPYPSIVHRRGHVRQTVYPNDGDHPGAFNLTITNCWCQLNRREMVEFQRTIHTLPIILMFDRNHTTEMFPLPTILPPLR